MVNSRRDFDRDMTPLLFPPITLALRTGLGDDSSLAVALWAGGNIGEATEDTLLDPPYLSGAITVGASAGLTTRFGADTVAQRAIFGAGYGYLLVTAKGGFLEVNRNSVMQVNPAPGCLTRGGRGTAKEGIKDVTEATEIKPLKASPE